MSYLNYPITTPEAEKFWSSKHKLNRIKAIIAFSLNLDNANDNLRRAGYYRQYRKKYLDLYSCIVNMPTMVGIPFSGPDEYWYNPTPICPLGPDFSEINMLSPTLDPRILYSRGGNLSYWASNGTLQQAPPNTWPLEYKDGVAVGRHPPEAASANLLKYSSQLTNSGAGFYNASFIDNVGPGLDGGDTSIQVTSNSSVNGSYVRYGSLSGEANDIFGFSIFYKRSRLPSNIRTDVLDNIFVIHDANTLELVDGGGTVNGDYRVDVFGDWARVTVIMQIPNASDNVFADFMRISPGEVSDIITLVDYIQMEKLDESRFFVSSPIKTTGEIVSRETPTVSVYNPGRPAEFLRITYSSQYGENQRDIELPEDGSRIEVPLSETPWGENYITKMEYIIPE